MKKVTLLIAACTFMVCGMANAANGQAVANAKAACQSNPTQCANAKSQAKKEAQAAKEACSKNQAACNNAKSKAKKAMSQ